MGFRDDAEVIGTITTSHGHKYEMRLLRLKDVKHLDFTDKDLPYRLAALSIEVDYEEFLNWSIGDASKVMTMYTKAVMML